MINLWRQAAPQRPMSLEAYYLTLVEGIQNTDLNFNCGNFFIKVEGGAKIYKHDNPLPIVWRSFTVVLGDVSFYASRKRWILANFSRSVVRLDFKVRIFITRTFRKAFLLPNQSISCLLFWMTKSFFTLAW